MHIINKAARLIEFSWNKKKYKLLPAGKAVEIPDDAKKSAFLKSLFEDNSIAKASDAEIEAAKEVEDSAEEVKPSTKEAAEKEAANKLEAARKQATDLKIEFDDDWTVEDITAAIELAKEEAAEKEKLEGMRQQAKTLNVEFDDDWTIEDIALAIQFDKLATKAKSLGVKVKDDWSLEELQKAIKKKEK